MTNAGRTFAVIPKSTCQTSPRLATPIALLLVERPEGFGSQICKIIICQVIRHRDALDDSSPNLPTFRVRKVVDLAEDMGNRSRHGHKITNPASRSSADKRIKGIAHGEWQRK